MPLRALDDIPRMVRELEKDTNWKKDVHLVNRIWEVAGKPSVRILAKIIGKSKSYAHNHLRLHRAIYVYNLDDEPSKNAALQRLKKLDNVDAAFKKAGK